MSTFTPVRYGDGTPVFRSDGTTPRVACADLAEWLVWRDRLEVFRGRGHLVYFQTQGESPASQGTHICGSASDREYVGDESIMDSREMGMAEWPRLHRYGWPANLGEHCHGLIRCSHNSCNAWQYQAWLYGYNGLGLYGKVGPDPLPHPSKVRTWQEGIEWAKAQMTPREDDVKAFMKIKGDNRVFVADGMFARHVADLATLEDLAWLVDHDGLYAIGQPAPGSEGAVKYGTVWVREVNSAAVLGKILTDDDPPPAAPVGPVSFTFTGTAEQV